MNEFINWGTLGTYGGALIMVTLLTQFTKEFPFTKRIPTQLWSYILAYITLILAHTFTVGLTLDIAAQTIFNAVIISIASNGAFSGVQKITKKTDDKHTDSSQ